MRTLLATTVAASALLAAIACSSSNADDAGSSGGGSSGAGPGGETSPGADAKGPPVPKDFPLATPSVGGYGLTDVWGKDALVVPAAIAWPKVKGAPPFALERFGEIIELGATRTKVLDFADAVHIEGEGGALGLALHPQFGDGTGPKPYAYVWYNAWGGQRLTRFTWNAGTHRFDRGSEQILVQISETRTEHNGGMVAFGPDGFLYFGNGDDLDPRNHQTITRSLFAGIFRIDVDMVGGAVSHAPPRQPEGGWTQNYFIPNDNPFVGQPNALEEHWALGLRNPFGFSFDRQTGQLWAGDVGDSWREEVNLVVKGGNYEWPYREAEIVRGTVPTTIGQADAPKYFYSHSSMGDLTAVLGGFVYRGKALPELQGKYIYSDWPSARVWALDLTTSPPKRTTLVSHVFDRQPVGMAEDPDGEIYVLFIGGVGKLTRDDTKALVPQTLTETKIWKDLRSATLTDDFVPYDIASPLWSDGAAKKRFISVPPGKRVTIGEDGRVVLPVGTRLVKQFDLPNSTRRLETRVLVVGEQTTYGVSYRWNAEGTDGDLVVEPTDETVEGRAWHYPSFGECWSCHRSENRVLGFAPRQLDKKQLEALAAKSIIDAPTMTTFPEPLPRPSDTTAPLEQRALAYLAANCSGCHHTDSYVMGSLGTWRAEPGIALADRGLLNAPHHNSPMATAFNLNSAPLISPGNPANSILLARLKSTDEKLRMPPLGRNTVDPEGAALIEAWIASMQ